MLNAYRQKEATLKAVEHRLSKLKDLGQRMKSWRYCTKGCRLLDALQDEAAALASVARGEESQAIALLYGKAYEQELERAQTG